MPMSGILYKLDFSSGKSYIGVTTRSIDERISEHERQSRYGKGCAVNYAWRKYGKPKISILAIVSIPLLFDCEKRAIEAFRTLAPHGYNVMPEGSISPMHIPGVAEKVSLALKGRPSPLRGTKFSEQHKLHLSASLKGKQNWLGKHHSAQTKKKISAANKGRPPFKAIQIAANLRRGSNLSIEHREKISRGLLKHYNPSSC